MNDGPQKSVKVQLTLNKNDQDLLDELSLSHHHSANKSEVIKKSLVAYNQIHQESLQGHLVFIYDVNKDTTREVHFPGINNSKFERPVFLSPIESRRHARVYTGILVESLTTILKEEEGRLHNRPPREFQTKDDDERKLLKQLISELRKLNKLLGEETKRVPEKQKIEVAKHLNKFLDGFASTAGKGTAGVLVTGASASLMMYLGVDTHTISGLFSKLIK
jgi:hypothetical protein